MSEERKNENWRAKSVSSPGEHAHRAASEVMGPGEIQPWETLPKRARDAWEAAALFGAKACGAFAPNSSVAAIKKDLEKIYDAFEPLQSAEEKACKAKKEKYDPEKHGIYFQGKKIEGFAAVQLSVRCEHKFGKVASGYAQSGQELEVLRCECCGELLLRAAMRFTGNVQVRVEF